VSGQLKGYFRSAAALDEKIKLMPLFRRTASAIEMLNSGSVGSCANRVLARGRARISDMRSKMGSMGFCWRNERQAGGSPQGPPADWQKWALILFGLPCFAFLSACTGASGDPANFSSPTGNQVEIARAASKYVATSTPGATGYLVGPQDVLDITVFQAPDLSKTLQVAEDGTLNLPLTGQMMAAGKSPSKLEREIATRLNARYMKSAQVTVFVKEYNSQRVTVEGAVKSPGVFPLRGHETLMQVIAKGGGLDRQVSSSNVVIFRTVDGTQTVTRYDLDSIRSGAPDPQILPGDVIVVDDSMAKQGLQVFLRLTPLASPIAFLF
jgi:polysaccharide export outer membrane protein